MVLLASGSPLNWSETSKNADLVREWGIKQLLAIWNKGKTREGDVFLWGDEVEYIVVKYQDDDPNVLLSLRQSEILEILAQDRSDISELQRTQNSDAEHLPIFNPEFGRFMLESTPGKPWSIDLKDLLNVESNMRQRRQRAKMHMFQDEYPITLTTFPRLGCPGSHTTPHFPTSGEKIRSQFVADEIANPHIRFPTLAANIRSRRGRKVQVNVPIFRDENTPWPWKDPTVNYDLYNWPEDDDVRNGASPPNYIHMDAMAFGMGSCCLQVTFQAKNIAEGRHLYDQLSPLGPIFLALTAATPIYKGFLADTDTRWNQVSASVDDRTPEELGEKPLENNRWLIPKSRYASNSTYISQDSRLRQDYLDPDLVFDPEIKNKLMNGGMDSLLATHFAHLFIRDPIVTFSENLFELDLSKTEHFDNIQSTNWQHIRFKPPPADTDIGWRVEFRSMEIQITDFENAAFAVFVTLITRAILSFNLNFYIPIRKTDENMQTANKRNAINEHLFYFRRDPLPNQTLDSLKSASIDIQMPYSDQGSSTTSDSDEYALLSIDEIINGSKMTSDHNFPGLIPLVQCYLDTIKIDVETRRQIDIYLVLIQKRADGRLWSAAKWIREFVLTHEDYKADSHVTEQINHDLIKSVLAFEDPERGNVKNRERFLL